MRLDTDTMMKINGWSNLPLGLGAAVMTKDFHNAIASPTAQTVFTRHMGVAISGASAMCLASTTVDAKKNMCKVVGATLLACAATSVSNVMNKTQKRDTGFAMAALSGGLGAMNLYVGFK